jgi:glycosyltransferase involved in cell wall biosynthesis
MRVAVIIPFHADDQWFPDTLASVLAQERPADRVVVVDDASPPGTARTLQGLPSQVTVVRLPTNGGPGRARQVGTELADTELVSYLDSDDRWSPDFLSKCVERIANDPSCQAVYTPIAKRVPDGSVYPFTDKPEWLDVREAIVRFHAYPALAMLFRRAALLDAGGWDTSRHAVEDWDLMVRFLDRHGSVPLVRGPLPEYRVAHASGRRNAKVWSKLRCWRNTADRNRDLLQKHFGPRAHRRRMAQAVRDRAERVGGVTGHVLHVLQRMLGRPLDADHPQVVPS